jgi:hypothetical protein
MPVCEATLSALPESRTIRKAVDEKASRAAETGRAIYVLALEAKIPFRMIKYIDNDSLSRRSPNDPTDPHSGADSHLYLAPPSPFDETNVNLNFGIGWLVCNYGRVWCGSDRTSTSRKVSRLSRFLSF